VTTRPRRLLTLGFLWALLLAGCGLQTPTTSSTPAPTPSPSALDFTRAGVASAMVTQLLAKAGSERALMVEITATTVEVSVLGADHKPATWAYRDGEIGEVASDLQYVDQSTFDVSRFDISDVGGLFRAAKGQSGSAENQSLTIVDYSGGEVMMSISTVPESRTVFFEPSGALLPILDFDTPGGVTQGIKDSVGTRATVYSITVQSGQGVWADYPGESGTTVRRTRTAKVPVTTNVTAQKEDLPLFSTSRVNPDAIWKVVDEVRTSGEVSKQAAWSVVIDDRRNLGIPRMYFTIGSKVVTTDNQGNEVVG
jgi:hypothetical protein